MHAYVHIQMNFYALFIVAMLTTNQMHKCSCTPNGLVYVLPDHSTDNKCPAQPCSTLSQHLLNIGISDITFLLLSGTHTLNYSIAMLNAYNVTMVGVRHDNLIPAKIFCDSNKTALIFVNSTNISVSNLIFENCGGYGPQLAHYIDAVTIAAVFLNTCYNCNITNVEFIGYGLGIHNLFGESYLNDITIRLCETTHGVTYWHHEGIGLVNHGNSPHYVKHIFIYVNKITIIVDMEKEFDYYDILGVRIHFQETNYNTTFILSNSKFQQIINAHSVLKVSTILNNCSNIMLLIRNCEFTYTENSRQLFYAVISYNSITLIFTNCLFYQNQIENVLTMIEINSDESYVHLIDQCLVQSHIKFINSSFAENMYPLVKIRGSRNSKCITQFSIIGPFAFKANDGMTGDLISIHHATVNIIGTATIAHNSNAVNIFFFHSCNVTFSKNISFISNGIISPYSIDSIITLQSGSAFIKVMENSNIKFLNNNYAKQLVQIKMKDYAPNPFCLFQYYTVTSKNVSYVSLKNYSISLYGGYKVPSHFMIDDYDDSTVTFSINYYTFHCKWLPESLFFGSDDHPADINKKIIQTDDEQMYQHTRVCYCFMNNTHDCSLDQLGPVFPGQVLQLDLCMPYDNDLSILFVDTHNIFLPNSSCNVANQDQMINIITNSSKTYNFTIVSESKNECELFLTAQPDLYKRYDAFYVQLLPCPIGFTLQNGKCDCDPILSTIIDQCYIDYSTIRRPANYWVVALTQTNNFKYLISSCPMDYCLPYSSSVNLLYPDLQCQFNRTGMLCSQCQHPLSMVFGSSRCMKCTNVHILITIIVLVAGIVLVVLLYVLNLTVTNGTINGIIFYANIISINDSVFLINDNVFKPLRVFISFTNLDLGVETCFYDGMDSYAKMWLQLFFPSYLIIIATSIIITSRYSTRILRLTYTRSLPVLATLFLLSYTGVLRTVLTVLFSYSTITHLPSDHQELVWSIDASVPLFGLKFTILFITCLALFLLLIPFNITLLFTRYFLRFRIINRFKPLLDAFQGSYKDKYYYWVAVHLAMRSLFFTFYAFPIKLKLIFSTMLLIIFGIYSGYVHPHKIKLVNIQELFLLINLTILYAVSYQGNIFFIVTNTMISLTSVQFGAIITYHFLTYTCHCDVTGMLKSIKQKLMIKFCKKNNISEMSNSIALLDIPECTYNYTEYRDGLISDDFKRHH